MSLEFTVLHGCSLRARYAEKHLRAWGQLSHLHTRLTVGETGAPSEDKVRFIENAAAEVEEMQTATETCANCPACLPRTLAGAGEAIGCQGRITYPIEGHFEKFIADRAQLALDTMDTEDYPRLLQILLTSDSPFDGEATKELRRVTTAQNLRFFELRLPIALTRAGAHLSTDNLFDVLAGFRSDLSPQTTYTRELPPAALPDHCEFLDCLLRRDLFTGEGERLHARSRNYAQYLRLLSALERAESLGARVLLD